MKPTDEQQAILDREPTDTIKVLAGAGCGKTSTLEAYGRRWTGKGLYLAFNSAIAKEAARRLPPNVEARTAHSFAYERLDVGAHRDRLVKRLTLEHLDQFTTDIRGVAGVPLHRVQPIVLRTIPSNSSTRQRPSVRQRAMAPPKPQRVRLITILIRSADWIALDAWTLRSARNSVILQGDVCG